MLEIEDRRISKEGYPSQLLFTTASAINKAVALAPRLVVELG